MSPSDTKIDTIAKRWDSCRLCDSTKIRDVLDLGETALANNYLSAADLRNIKNGHLTEHRSPLRYFLCLDCGCFQIRDTVKQEVMFENYLYASSTSGNLRSYFKLYAEDLISRFRLSGTSKVLEIASNDGVMLRSFREKGIKAWGVEPAKNLASLANKEGLPTFNDFYGEDEAKEIRSHLGQFEVIVGNNFFAHVENVLDIVRGVKINLAPDGVFVFENSYLLPVIQKRLFDLFYCEHILEYGIKPLKLLFEKEGLELFDVQLTEPHGGSFRAFAQWKGGPHTHTGAVAKQIEAEEVAKLYKLETYSDFVRDLQVIKKALLATIEEYSRQGYNIIGWGYPAKATTLCNYFEIGNRFTHVIEDSEFKIGKFTPDFHVPIRGKEYFYGVLNNEKTLIVVLAWNFADLIRKNNPGIKGKWLIPFPEIKIL